MDKNKLEKLYNGNFYSIGRKEDKFLGQDVVLFDWTSGNNWVFEEFTTFDMGISDEELIEGIAAMNTNDPEGFLYEAIEVFFQRIPKDNIVWGESDI